MEGYIIHRIFLSQNLTFFNSSLTSEGNPKTSMIIQISLK